MAPSILTSTMSKKSQILCVAGNTSVMCEKVRIEKYREIKRALLKWYRHKHHRTATLINYLKAKGQEIEMKLTIKFKPQNWCHDQFTNHSDTEYKTKRWQAKKCRFVIKWKCSNRPAKMAGDECRLIFNNRKSEIIIECYQIDIYFPVWNLPMCKTQHELKNNIKYTSFESNTTMFIIQFSGKMFWSFRPSSGHHKQLDCVQLQLGDDTDASDFDL